jgi:hypothetical protein
MTEKSRDLADVKTGNISLQPIKDEDEKPIQLTTPDIINFPKIPEIPKGEFQNGTFIPGSETNDLLSSKGITSARPEIILYTKFEPCFNQNNVATPTLEMIRTQIAARDLRATNLTKFVEYLRTDADASKILNTLLDSYNSNIELTKQDIEDIKRVWSDFDLFIYALDLYQTRAGTHRRAQTMQNGVSEIYTLEQIFSKQGFTPSNIKFWSSTKVFGQLLLDLSHASQKYTHGLFINKPQISGQYARAVDNDPIEYNLSQYTSNPLSQVGFTFNVLDYVKTFDCIEL